MSPTITIILILISGLIFLYSSHLKIKNISYRNKLDDALHKKIEVTNFLSLFSKNIRSTEGMDDSMKMAANYVADLIEAQSVCIFMVEKNHLRAVGVSGSFPLLHKTNNDFIYAKQRFLVDALKNNKIEIGKGLIGEVAALREAVFLKDATVDKRVKEFDNSVTINSLMAIPLIHEANLNGVICAINSRYHDPLFTEEQFSRLKFISAQIVLAQNLLHAYSDLQTQERLEQELKFATELQSSLLPKSFPVWDNFKFYGTARSSKEVSGDFYDFIELDDDRLLIIVADACGKGIPACMLMAMTRSFIRSNIERFVSLKELLLDLNSNLFRDTEEEQFVTLACCLINRKQNTAEIVRAGHTELLIFVRNHIRTINPDGVAVGMLPNELVHNDSLCFGLQKDMDLLLFTDGITEAVNSKNEEFGLQKLSDVFMESSIHNEEPAMIIEEILESVDNFSKSPDTYADDQTMVLIRHL